MNSDGLNLSKSAIKHITPNGINQTNVNEKDMQNIFSLVHKSE